MIGEETIGFGYGRKGVQFHFQQEQQRGFCAGQELCCSTYSIIHYVAIVEMLMQMELRFIRNAYEMELLKGTHKLLLRAYLLIWSRFQMRSTSSLSELPCPM